jgi:hypothetical protein
LAAPTFDDFWRICATLIAAAGCTSRMVWWPSVSVPGAVDTTVVRGHGSALERCGDGERLQRRAGLEEVGDRAVAKLCPVSRARLLG